MYVSIHLFIFTYTEVYWSKYFYFELIEELEKAARPVKHCIILTICYTSKRVSHLAVSDLRCFPNEQFSLLKSQKDKLNKKKNIN